MCGKGDGGSQFYLFRVRLRSGLRLEAGWRDENQAEATQITQPDLENAGLDGIRTSTCTSRLARSRWPFNGAP